MKYKIQEELSKFLSKEEIDLIEILNNSNKNYKKFGDYTTNLALKIAKKNHQNPLEVAEKIVQKVDSNLFEKIEILKPGFINFFLKKEVVLEQIIKMSVPNFKPEFKYLNKKDYDYEYVSANPTGYLHIGHARNAVVGDVVTNLLKYTDQNVYLEYYINDYGNQIDNLSNSILFYYDKLNNQNPRVEEPTYKGKEIEDFANILFKKYQDKFISKSIEITNEIKKLALEHFLKIIKETLLKLKIKPFDEFVSEKSLYESKKVDTILDKLIKSGKTYKKDGATWLKTTEYGDDKDRVIVKENEGFTYLVGDIANHILKLEKGYSNLINLWGKDHHGYETRVKAALSFLGYDDVLEVDYISMVKITNNGQIVKMSKRAGTSFTILDVLEMISPDELRYFIISKNKEQSLEIDISKVKDNSSSNPYFYMQYANARTNQLLEKYFKTNNLDSIKKYQKVEDFKYLLNEEKELQLAKKIIEFEEIILIALKQREPMILITYLKELSNLFHSFYNNCRVINEDLNLTQEKIFLVITYKNIVETILKILGIEPTRKM